MSFEIGDIITFKVDTDDPKVRQVRLAVVVRENTMMLIVPPGRWPSTITYEFNEIPASARRVDDLAEITVESSIKDSVRAAQALIHYQQWQAEQL